MRIDLVVLGFAAVDRLHGQRMAEDEGDALSGTEIREPIPGEHTFDGDDEIVAVGGDGVQERLGRRLDVAMQEHLAGRIEDAEVHRFHMEIDSAVVAVLTVVESHMLSSCAVRMSVRQAYSHE